MGYGQVVLVSEGAGQPVTVVSEPVPAGVSEMRQETASQVRIGAAQHRVAGRPQCGGSACGVASAYRRQGVTRNDGPECQSSREHGTVVENAEADVFDRDLGDSVAGSRSPVPTGGCRRGSIGAGEMPERTGSPV